MAHMGESDEVMSMIGRAVFEGQGGSSAKRARHVDRLPSGVYKCGQLSMKEKTHLLQMCEKKHLNLARIWRMTEKVSLFCFRAGLGR